MKPEPAGKCVL